MVVTRARLLTRIGSRKRRASEERADNAPRSKGQWGKKEWGGEIRWKEEVGRKKGASEERADNAPRSKGQWGKKEWGGGKGERIGG